MEIFWKKIDYDLRHVFHLLSENEILDAVGLMKQFLKEYREMRNKEPDQDAFEPIPFIGEADTGENQTGEAEKVFGEKWDSMLYYLKADMEDINTMTSFSMLKLVITQIGIEGIPGILEPWSMLQRSFSLYPYGSVVENVRSASAVRKKCTSGIIYVDRGTSVFNSMLETTSAF